MVLRKFQKDNDGKIEQLYGTNFKSFLLTFDEIVACLYFSKTYMYRQVWKALDQVFLFIS